MSKDINPYNEQGLPHGYWISYWCKDCKYGEGEYNNGIHIGLWIYYWYEQTNTVRSKLYYI